MLEEEYGNQWKENLSTITKSHPPGRLVKLPFIILMKHIQISSFGRSYPGWASSMSTVLCPSEANKVEPFEWKEETLQVECA